MWAGHPRWGPRDWGGAEKETPLFLETQCSGRSPPCYSVARRGPARPRTELLVTLLPLQGLVAPPGPPLSAWRSTWPVAFLCPSQRGGTGEGAWAPLQFGDSRTGSPTRHTAFYFIKKNFFLFYRGDRGSVTLSVRGALWQGDLSVLGCVLTTQTGVSCPRPCRVGSRFTRTRASTQHRKEEDC